MKIIVCSQVHYGIHFLIFCYVAVIPGHSRSFSKVFVYPDFRVTEVSTSVWETEDREKKIAVTFNIVKSSDFQQQINLEKQL